MKGDFHMKKFAALFLSVLMIFGAAGCSQQADNDDDDNDKEIVSSEEDTAEDEESEAGEEETEDSVDSAAEETESTEEETADSADDSSGAATSTGSTGSADISGAIDYTEATEDSPAELGQWVKLSIYSATDQTYHSVYARVTKVTTESEDESYVNAAIEKHNSICSEYYQIDRDELKIPSDCELQLLEYEVYVPDDFPTNDWGIIAPDINLSESNIGGGGIPAADGASTYIGLGSSIIQLDTGEEPENYQVGETYSFIDLHEMVVGYEDYIIYTSSYPEGTTDLSEAEYSSVYFKHS
jgi:hypothetical protein